MRNVRDQLLNRLFQIDRIAVAQLADRRPQVPDGVQCLVGVGCLGEGGVEAGSSPDVRNVDGVNEQLVREVAVGHLQDVRGLLQAVAGQDVDAVARARGYFTGYAPSSPQIALLKDGRLVYMLERHQIEGRSSDQIADDLTRAFDKHCAKASA